jgi:hypothetical protein
MDHSIIVVDDVGVCGEEEAEDEFALDLVGTLT